MNMMPWILVLTLFFLQVQTSNTRNQQAAYLSAQASTIATNMMVYKSAATAYATANPTYTGSIADSSLSLPTWFTKVQGVSHYITGGAAYVYYTAATPGLADQLLRMTNNSITTGFAHGGQLVNPFVYTTSISLPATIPEGAVVLF